MIKPRFLGLILLLTVVTALMPISRAYACSCAAQTDSQRLTRADAVFTGTVTGRTDPNAGASVQSSLNPITWTFRADSVAKGSVTNPVQVVSARGEASCGVAFAVGTRYLVYARQVSGHLQTDLCSGNTKTTQLSFTPIAAAAPTRAAAPGGFLSRPVVLFIAGVVVVLGGVVLMRSHQRQTRGD